MNWFTGGLWLLVSFCALGCASEISVACPAGQKLSVDGSACEPALTNEPGDADASVDPDGSVGTRGTCVGIDCEDGNACTADSCADDVCLFTALEDGTACLFEERAGVCEAGACVRDCEAEDCRIVYPCTEQGLRDAIEDGGNTVIGCNGPTTVVLTEGELDMFKDVSIDGLGNLTVDAEGRSRVFVANDAASIELIGINITGGNAATDEEHSGGGVFGTGNTEITVRDCNVYGNASSIHGGGIRTSGLLTVINARVTNNTAAARGAGITMFAPATIVNSVIADNISGNDGGGIYVTGGDANVTFENCTIERNQTPGAGGGIWTSGPVTLDGTMVRDNVSGDGGGGIRVYQTGGLTTRNGTVFARNKSVSGGGVSTYRVTSLVSLSDTVFEDNVTEGSSGGAMYNDNTRVEATDCIFDGNTTTNGAGAIYHKQAGAEFTRCNFTNNRAGSVGGAFRIYKPPLTGNGTEVRFENCTISGNHAGDSGGAFANRTDTLVTLYNSTVTGNTAVNSAPAIHQTDGAELQAMHSTIDGACFGEADTLLVSLGYNAVLSPAVEQCVLTPFEGMSTDLLLTSEQIALGELAYNGSLIPTHLPAPGSALIDAIPLGDCSAEISEDQRGQPRGGSACDIGSVEVQPND